MNTITELTIKGLVQGVGFRPFIYLLAKEMNLKGTVANDTDGVIIRTQFRDGEQEIFIKNIVKTAPAVACIHHIDIKQIESNEAFPDFRIISGGSHSKEITQIAPDIAVCPDCLNDRRTQLHRIRYPFINCTHCGPRFSIIRDLPYDRERTTMALFAKCPQCETEYHDIYDRRFHAQPVACNHCGPTYYAEYQGNKIDNYDALLQLTSRIINEGGVIAAKGVGGYHLVCDATNDAAVNRLRKIKLRDTKPFAVMGKDVESLKYYVTINDSEAKELTSWRRPIVILRQQKALAEGVNPKMKTLGCMLPYMPVHYDWFDLVATPVLVMTSGNISDVPIAISDEEAERQFGSQADSVLHHNRHIYNRVDDSLLQVCGKQPCLIRRSRGYVPEPLFVDEKVEGILAFGAEKVNTFALGKGDTVIQSQYIGDLKNWETYNFYRETLTRFITLFRFIPQTLVCDLHPDYLSSSLAEEYAEKTGKQLLKVQHHHAHAVACMVEYGISEPVLGIVWDGVGLGDDGNVWGGEFFVCDRKQYRRLSHFEYVPMPGGDKASTEPWRMAAAYLYHFKLNMPESFVQRIGKTKIERITTMIDKGMNTPCTSSAGRLFDALASLLGICDVTTRQAEAPVLLEQAAGDNFDDSYPVEIRENDISFHSLFDGVIDDMQQTVSTETIAAKIHNSLAHLILEWTKTATGQTGITKTVISGGCFQNRRLTEHLQQLFEKENIPLYVPSAIPCNDSGVSVGQLAVAAEKNKDS